MSLSGWISRIRKGTIQPFLGRRLRAPSYGLPFPPSRGDIRRRQRVQVLPGRRAAAMQHIIHLQVAHLPGVPLRGYLHRDLLVQQRVHARIPVPPQAAHPLLPSQHSVDRLRRNRPQLRCDLLATDEILSLSQALHLLPQRRRQPLTAWKVEHLPCPDERHSHRTVIGRRSGPSLLLDSQLWRMRQLANQHLAVQPRASPGFVQQPGFRLLVRVPILLPNARQVLFA